MLDGGEVVGLRVVVVVVVGRGGGRDVIGASVDVAVLASLLGVAVSCNDIAINVNIFSKCRAWTVTTLCETYPQFILLYSVFHLILYTAYCLRFREVIHTYYAVLPSCV